MYRYFFTCYYEYFVWIARNASKNTVCVSFKPKEFILKSDETGRGQIKTFWKEKQFIKKLFEKDMKTYHSYFRAYKEVFNDAFKEEIKKES